MHVTPLPPSSLPAFARLNNTHLNGIHITPIDGAGTGLRHVRRGYDPMQPLLTVDQDLVVCAVSVEEWAKSDVHLAEVLRAVGDFALTPRGAIMVFLVVQWSTAGGLEVGHRGCWSEYIRFLPPTISVPTTWTDTERLLLQGTSLQVAVQAKLQTLSQEFTHLQSTTSHIKWCTETWWNPSTLTLTDWIHLDSLFRSRVLQFPRLGIGMAPLLDFANHSATPNSYYSIDAHGDVILLPRGNLEDGEEVTINYGFEKSAAELVFSYGFLPEQRSAFWLALDLHCPGDDPLAMVKEAVFRSAPILRVIDLGEDGVMWTGGFVWLMCVNEEDGLAFRVLQMNDGERRLVVLWRGEEVEVEKLEERLEGSEAWEVFQLRALILVQERVQVQLQEEVKAGEEVRGVEGREEVRVLAGRLRVLERELLEKAVETLERQKEALLETEVVKEYLRVAGQEGEVEAEQGEEGRVEVEEEEDDLR